MRNAYLDDLKDEQYAEKVKQERKEVDAMPKPESQTAKKKKPKTCKHKFVFDASFLRKGPAKGVCSKCGEVINV